MVQNTWIIALVTVLTVLVFTAVVVGMLKGKQKTQVLQDVESQNAAVSKHVVYRERKRKEDDLWGDMEETSKKLKAAQQENDKSGEEIKRLEKNLRTKSAK